MLAKLKTVLDDFHIGMSYDSPARRSNLSFVTAPEGAIEAHNIAACKPVIDAVSVGDFVGAVQHIHAVDAGREFSPTGTPLRSIATYFLTQQIVSEMQFRERNEQRLPYYRAWAQQNPDCPFAVSAYAEALASTGYSYRGTGLAKDVAAEQWQTLQAYATEAEAVMSRSWEKFQHHYAWTHSYLKLALVSQRPLGEHMSRFQMAMNAAPMDPVIYSTLCCHLLPRWFGSFELIGQVAAECADATHTHWGQTAYAIIYDELLDWHGAEEFGVDYDRLRTGYMDWHQRFPHDYMRVRLASYAVAHDDLTTCLDQLEALQVFYEDAWACDDDVLLVNALCRARTGR